LAPPPGSLSLGLTAWGTGARGGLLNGGDRSVTRPLRGPQTLLCGGEIPLKLAAQALLDIKRGLSLPPPHHPARSSAPRPARKIRLSASAASRRAVHLLLVYHSPYHYLSPRPGSHASLRTCP